MEKSQYELCLEILRRFNKAGVLDNLILIGSWCLKFYKDYFQDIQYEGQVSFKTRDIDFLVNNPSRIKEQVDIPNLLKDLGYVVEFMRMLIKKKEIATIKEVFNSIPKKWQAKIMKGLEGEDILNIFT